MIRKHFRQREPIIDALKKYKSGYFTVTDLGQYIIRVEFEDNIKYIIFETIEIYQNIDDYFIFLKTIDEIGCTPQNSYRLPYFAGVSGNDLGEFLLGPNETISLDLDINIHFDKFPVDFNIYGINRFITYLNIVKGQTPIFKGNNLFSEYITYFVDIITEADGKVNTILPLKFKDMSPHGKILDDIFDKLHKGV